MSRNTKSDVAKAINDLKATASKGELRQNIPVSLVEEWYRETDVDPTQYEWLQNAKE